MNFQDFTAWPFVPLEQPNRRDDRHTDDTAQEIGTVSAHSYRGAFHRRVHRRKEADADNRSKYRQNRDVALHGARSRTESALRHAQFEQIAMT